MNGKNKFYKIASAGKLEDGFGVFLDGRRLVTPAKKPLIVPTLALAQLVADEWNAQEKEINTATMPITRLVNVAIDRTPQTRRELVAEFQKYASSDLVCYRTSKPMALYEKQCELWNCEIEWINEKFAINFIHKSDCLGLFQNSETLDKIGIIAQDYDDFRLTILVFVTALAGSAILGLSLIEMRNSVDDIFKKIRIEEDHNAAIWGYDDEDLSKASAKMDDLIAAKKCVNALI